MNKQALEFFIRMEQIPEDFVKNLDFLTGQMCLELKWTPHPTQEELDLNFKRALLEGYIYKRNNPNE